MGCGIVFVGNYICGGKSAQVYLWSELPESFRDLTQFAADACESNSEVRCTPNEKTRSIVVVETADVLVVFVQ